MSKKEKIIIGIVIVMGLIVLISYFLFRKTTPTDSPYPVVTTPPVSSPEGIPDPTINTPSAIPVIKEDQIEALKKKLPYTGQYFILDFDQKENIFVYAYQRNFYQASENELNQFLGQDGLNRDDLENFGFDSYFY